MSEIHLIEHRNLQGPVLSGGSILLSGLISSLTFQRHGNTAKQQQL